MKTNKYESIYFKLKSRNIDFILVYFWNKFICYNLFGSVISIFHLQNFTNYYKCDFWKCMYKKHGLVHKMFSEDYYIFVASIYVCIDNAF